MDEVKTVVLGVVVVAVDVEVAEIDDVCSFGVISTLWSGCSVVDSAAKEHKTKLLESFSVEIGTHPFHRNGQKDEDIRCSAASNLGQPMTVRDIEAPPRSHPKYPQ